MKNHLAGPVPLFLFSTIFYLFPLAKYDRQIACLFICSYMLKTLLYTVIGLIFIIVFVKVGKGYANCIMDIHEMYREKLVSADVAASTIRSGDWVDYGWGATTTVAVDQALARRMPELYDINIRGGVLMWTPEIFKIADPQKHFTWNSWHMSGVDRKAAAQGFVFYAPIRYSELPRYYQDSNHPPDVVMMQVAPMDEHGWFNFGLSPSHAAICCNLAKTVIVEVNKNMPRCLGGHETGVHISQIHMIVESDDPPLAQLGSTPSNDVDRAVASLIMEEIPNGACLQLGIGGMPNTVGAMIAQSDLKDLGVHTEMYVDAFVDMTLAGRINGSRKSIDRGRQTYAFAAGTQKLYDFLNNNPQCMAAPVEYTNDIRQISALDHFISINNAVDIDLFGQVNAESSGVKNISGAGGQLDFVLGAYLSRGGKSFICCSSTFADKDGNLQSRIRPTLATGSIVTDTRANTHWLVTEYGKVNLKGLATWQRAEAIISIAHPSFRDQLIREAEKMNIWRKSNKI